MTGTTPIITSTVMTATTNVMRPPTLVRIGMLALALLLGSADSAVAQREARENESAITDSRVQHRSYTMRETGETIPYGLFIPSSYDPNEPSKLMVSLHGAGRQYDWLMGYAGFLDRAERDGYIVVTPLGYTRRGGYGARGDKPQDKLAEKDVMNVITLVKDEFNIDENRTYLWGHSMGGGGTYYISSRHPDLWAGLGLVAPSGGMRADYVDEDAIKHIPVLVLHGSEDATIPVERSRQSVARMKELGMEHLYVEIKGGDHSQFINQSEEVVGMLFDFFNIVAKSH